MLRGIHFSFGFSWSTPYGNVNTGHVQIQMLEPERHAFSVLLKRNPNSVNKKRLLNIEMNSENWNVLGDHKIENASSASMNPAIAPIPTNPRVAFRVRFLCLSLASSREDLREEWDGERRMEFGAGGRRLGSGYEDENCTDG